MRKKDKKNAKSSFWYVQEEKEVRQQLELADEMGVSYQAVSNWERGNSMPDISKLPQLALILGCSVDEEYLERVIEEAEIDGKMKDIVGLAPFLSKKARRKLADYMMKQGDSEGLKSIMPFV